MFKLNLRRFDKCIVSTAVALFCLPAVAETIEIVVPFSAGGGTDTVARVFAPEFGKQLDSTIVIRNLAGASGTIGANEVSGARPDGLTLGYLPIGIAIQPFLRDTAYNLNDFTYICQTTNTPIFLLVSSDSEMSSVDDVIKAGKKRRLIYGSSGPGTLPHIAMAAFMKAEGINAVHLPFAGSGVAMNAMAGGEIQLIAETATVLESNNLKPLAVFSDERLPEYPEVPTLKELGHDLEFSVWQGLFGPKSLSEQQVQKYTQACKSAVQTSAFKNHLKNTRTGLSYHGPEEFKKFVFENAKENESVLKEAGLIK